MLGLVRRRRCHHALCGPVQFTVAIIIASTAAAAAAISIIISAAAVAIAAAVANAIAAAVANAIAVAVAVATPWPDRNLCLQGEQECLPDRPIAGGYDMPRRERRVTVGGAADLQQPRYHRLLLLVPQDPLPRPAE